MKKNRRRRTYQKDHDKDETKEFEGGINKEREREKSCRRLGCREGRRAREKRSEQKTSVCLAPPPVATVAVSSGAGRQRPRLCQSAQCEEVFFFLSSLAGPPKPKTALSFSGCSAWR